MKASIFRPFLVVVLAGALGSSCPVQAIPCIDYSLAPHPFSKVTISGYGDKIAVRDNFAFVGTSTGIEALDVFNPNAPIHIGSYPIPSGATDVFQQGIHLFVAAGEAGLLILDASNPAAIFQVGALNPPPPEFGIVSAVDVFVSRNFALLAEMDAGLRFIDVSNYGAPILRSTFGSMTLLVESVVASGTIAFAEGRVIDFSVPTNPVTIGTYHSFGVLAIREHLLAAGNDLYDVSHPSSPIHLSVLPVFNICDTELLLDRALVAGGSNGGVQLVDITNPSTPVLLGRTPTLGGGLGAVLLGTTALVAQSNELALVDFDPEEMIPPFASIAIPSQTASIVFQESYAYVGNYEPGLPGGKLTVVDLTNPSAPEIVNSKLLRPPVGLALSNDLMVIAAWEYGAQVVTITNPEVPIVRATIDTPGVARGVAISGTNAFIADTNGGLQVIDVSVPTAPVIIGSLDTSGYANKVVVDGGLAYVLNGTISYGLRVIDVSSPSSPVLIGSLNFSGSGSWAEGLAIMDGFAVVTNNPLAVNGSIHIIDVSDPTDPQPLTEMFIGERLSDVQIRDQIAYVAGTSALHVIDLSNPLVPHYVGVAPVEGDDLADEPRGVALGNDFVGVGWDEGGFSIFPLQCSSASVSAPEVPSSRSGLRVDAVHPNPFQDGTSIEFSLPSRTNMRLSIYDVSGRLVRELARSRLDAGVHSAIWDGRDAAGRSVASGTYFVRLSNESAKDVERVIRLK